jgi:uncharacterized lipoprotein
MRIAVLILSVVLAASTLAGCKSGKKTLCRQSNKDYVGAKELPPLKAPPGLEAPDTRNALKVPELKTPERPRGRDEACLDTPPPFATPTQKPADAAKPAQRN